MGQFWNETRALKIEKLDILGRSGSYALDSALHYINNGHKCSICNKNMSIYAHYKFGEKEVCVSCYCEQGSEWKKWRQAGNKENFEEFIDSKIIANELSEE